MPSPERDVTVRRTAVIGAVQLALVGIAVLASRLDLAVGTSVMLVLGVSLVNAGVVAFALLGAGRSGRLVSWLALVTVVAVAGLLAWPAWDVYERMRP